MNAREFAGFTILGIICFVCLLGAIAAAFAQGVLSGVLCLVFILVAAFAVWLIFGGFE
jgi:hypothetical protein